MMCHTSCLLEDAGTLTSFLSTIKTWLDANPQEVVTLLVTNGDSVGIGNFSAAFESSGIDEYAYVPSTSPDVLPIGDWPTLQELIDQGKRVVAFLGISALLTTSQISRLEEGGKLTMIQTTAQICLQSPTSSTNSPTTSRHPTT